MRQGRKMTHLTVVSSRHGDCLYIKYYRSKSGQACSRVNLPGADQFRAPGWGETQIIARITTYPYRPVVGATPSDDTPLVVKSGDELPTVGGVPSYYSIYCGSVGPRVQPRLTCRVHPQRSRASQLSLLNYELRDLPLVLA